MGSKRNQLEQGGMGELVEKLMEGSCLCSVGQFEVAVGWSAKQMLVQRAGHRPR